MKKMKEKGLELVISFQKYLISIYYINLYYFFIMIHGSLLLAQAQSSILRKRTGQSVLEYFLLFAVLMVLTVIGLSTFFPRVQQSFNAIQNAAIERIIHADGN